jgi:hypothetical protein
MKPTVKDRLSALRNPVGHDLAPHVESSWSQAFVVELRLRGVGGPRIGAALAEVDSHCADSGQTALEVIGDATTYAQSLDLPEETGTSPRELLPAVAPVAVQVLGFLLALWGVIGRRQGGTVELTTGHLATFALITGGMVAIVLVAQRLLRAVVAHPFLVWFAFMAGIGAIVVASALLQDVVASVPAGPLLGAGLAVAGVGVVAEVVRSRSGSDHDPVMAPLGPDPDQGRPGGALAAVARWWAPVTMVATLVLAWFLAG